MHKVVFNSLLALAGVSTIALSQAQTKKPRATSPQAAPSPATLERTIIPRKMAVILNSGSTNTIGYRIFVLPSGQARYIDGTGRGNGKISAALTKKFFSDIRAAMPLEKLPTQQPCIKPVSFGTSTTIRLGGEHSPDISCPGNALAQLLFNDVTAITKALKVKNVPRSQGHNIPPLNF